MSICEALTHVVSGPLLDVRHDYRMRFLRNDDVVTVNNGRRPKRATANGKHDQRV